ncbi:MAG TPA: hydrogenase expression/formation protein [Nitrospiraceae bacterium]|nr:hydrogenase expression/formation protein [Nitrospiraceae bacterium]
MEPVISVIGLGNILMMDEGVGVHVVNALRERYAFYPEVDIIDGGTSGLDLLPYIAGRDKVLIIDAVDFGKEPCSVGLIENDGIPAALQSKVSLHHLGLSDVLSVALLQDAAPKEICLIGIQPKTIDLGLDMTRGIWDNIETVIDHAIQKLQDWNVQCVLQSRQKSSK